MKFTNACRLVATLIVVLSLFQLGMGVFLAFGTEDGADLTRYIGRKTTGQVIDQGIYALIAGIALGTLSDISRAVQSRIG